MLTESSANNSPTTAKSPVANGWGPLTGTIWAVLAFWGPQFIVMPLVPLLVGLTISINLKMFALHLLVELLTLAALFVIVRSYKLTLTSIGLGKFKPEYIMWALLGLPLYFAVATVVTEVAGRLLPQELMTKQQELGFTAAASGFELLLIFVALVIVTPLVEEALFRGFLWKAYQKFGVIFAAIAVSALFAVAHMQVNVGIDVFVLSLILCYIRMKTNSIWPTILLHGMKNFIAFYLLFIVGMK